MAGPRGQTWYAVGRLTELTEAGARGSVWQSFDDIDEAKEFRDKHRLALFPGTFTERPAERSTIEVSREELDGLLKKGQGQELARQLRTLDWAKEQGIFHEHGVWYDRGSEPRIGQLVHFTTGLDYRDEPEERRVMPPHPLEPGPSEQPRYVVLEKVPGKPLLGRLVALPLDAEQAKAEMESRDAKRLALEPAALQEQWRRFEARPELREVAARERRAEPVTQPEKPAERARDESLGVTTHERGRYKAQVVERTGEDGKPQRTVILTSEVTESDGRTRTHGTVLSMEDVREIRRAMEQKQQAMLERARQQEQPETRREELKFTTHESGRHRAEVVERMGEDGKPRGTVLLTKEVTEPDGRTRTHGTVLSFDEVREIGRAIKQHQQSVERTRQEERQRTPEPERKRDQGLSMQL